jgi:hypothetical protein
MSSVRTSGHRSAAALEDVDDDRDSQRNHGGPAAERHRPSRSDVPEHHRHGPRCGDRRVDPGWSGLRGRLPAALGCLRPGRVPVLRGEHRPAGARDAGCGIGGHLRGPRPAPVHRLPGGLGIRAGRILDPAIGAAPARLHHGRDPERRDQRIPGGPVVAVGTARRADRAGGGVLRHPHVGAARHHPRHLRGRGLPRAGRLLHRARRSANTASVFTTKYTPAGFHGLTGGDRRFGVHDPRVRRVRGGLPRWPRRPRTRGG